MGQRYFSGMRHLTAADQPNVGNGMMRRAKGSGGNQRFPGTQEARHGKNLGDLDGFFKGKIGQNRGQPSGQHAFAGARRADHQEIVRSCRGDLQRPERQLLAFDFGKVDVIAPVDLKQVIGIHAKRLDGFPVAQEFDNVGKRPNAIHADALHHGRFRGVFFGNKNGTNPRLPGFESGGENTPHSLDAAVQRQLPDKKASVQGGFPDQRLRGQNAHRDRQIKAGPLFADIRGRQIHRHMIARESIAGIFDGGLDPVPAFLDRSVRQTDRGKLRQALGDIHFHRHRIGFHADHAHALHFDEHFFLRGRIRGANTS